MKRAILAVITGYLVWTALWLAGNRLLFGGAAERVGAGEPFTAAAPLVGVVVLSMCCSLAAGATAAIIAGERAPAAVLVMAVLLLVTGIGVQASVWMLMPVWYHLAFLALIIPVSLLGARIVRRPAASPE
jgi:hypothetical protein